MLEARFKKLSLSNPTAADIRPGVRFRSIFKNARVFVVEDYDWTNGLTTFKIEGDDKTRRTSADKFLGSVRRRLS